MVKDFFYNVTITIVCGIISYVAKYLWKQFTQPAKDVPNYRKIDIDATRRNFRIALYVSVLSLLGLFSFSNPIIKYLFGICALMSVVLTEGLFNDLFYHIKSSNNKNSQQIADKAPR